MNDALLVRRLQGLCDLLRDLQCLVEWDRSTRGPPGEILAFDELHHEGLDAVSVFQSVDGGDVWVVQRREGLGFTLEAREPICVVRECLGQDLERDVAIQLRVAGPEDVPHAAFADAGDNFVDTETGTGGKGQKVARLYGRNGRAGWIVPA